MVVEPFEPSKHYDMISSWWVGHGHEPPPISRLPKHGFIVDGCVAGFVYQTDSDAMIAEHMIAKPKAGRRIVAAFHKLSDVIVEFARSAGYKSIITNTKVRYLAKHYGVIGASINSCVGYRCTLRL